VNTQNQGPEVRCDVADQSQSAGARSDQAFDLPCAEGSAATEIKDRLKEARLARRIRTADQCERTIKLQLSVAYTAKIFDLNR
jgi:hypothetical protein